MTIIPYVSFPGNAAEAMKFYHECLGGDLFIQTIGESPMAAQFPREMHNSVLHSTITKNGVLQLGASDVDGGGALTSDGTVALSLTCDTRDELEKCYSHLSAGGEATRPLHDFFAGTIGAAKDKYGKNWMFYCEKK